VRPWRVAIAVLLLVLAAFAAILAADVRGWRATMRAGDAQFAVSPADANWAGSSVLPGDPARVILGLSDQLAYRRAVQAFAAVAAAGNGFDNGYSETRARGALEAELAVLARGSDSERDSALENLVGILSFLDSKQHGPTAPAPIDRSVGGFRSAAQLDPNNADAKFNLEWLLRALVAKGTRAGSSSGSGGPAKGHKGAGGGLPGRGY
jgi:opacity protein-like surface antigen